MSLVREVNCIDSRYILFGSIFLIILIFSIFLLPIKLRSPPIPLILKILLIPNKLNSLIFPHNLTKQRRCIHFGMINKHNFFLHTSRMKSTSSNKFISKIYFNISIIIFNTIIILSYYRHDH